MTQRLVDLMSQLSAYVGRLQVEKMRFKDGDPELKEIEDALEEVRSNLDWVLSMEPELEESIEGRAHRLMKY